MGPLAIALEMWGVTSTLGSVFQLLYDVAQPCRFGTDTEVRLRHDLTDKLQIRLGGGVVDPNYGDGSVHAGDKLTKCLRR